MSEQVKEEKQEKQEEQKEDIKLSPKSQEIVKNIEEMSVLELSNLVKVLEDKFGVSAAMPMAVAAAPGAAAPVAEEKTSFNVVLAAIGDKKIQVIKEIRAITSLGLKEAKDLVDSAPKPVKENVSKEEAAEIKKKLEDQGATVEIK
ncbi:MAG: 50S ribosomal protein L7/L12 [Candidatus Omnitrophica bacterium]|nr:50S ribosomal protein L7/L12 [Candidatus Omnitrophota bacterium]